MPTVVVASRNPVKLRATLAGFRRVFPGAEFRAVPMTVDHGTSDQPVGDGATLEGARTRAQRARAAVPEAEFTVGIEGGVEELDGGLAAFAWVVVLSVGAEGRSRCGTFFLPEEMAELVRAGEELGTVCDRLYGQVNVKRKGGAVGLLTGNVVDRSALYEQAVVLALIPFTSRPTPEPAAATSQ